MAVVMRGWSKTASTALKLATTERIIGYQFKDVDKLYEALDQEERRALLPSGKKLRLKPRNSRLALVGDALGNLHMAQDWYDTDLTGVEWNEIALSTLSNERLGKIGFQLGLDECAISKEIVKPYDMATTLEALIAAVHMDGASQEQCHKIYTRFGLQHKLLSRIDRSWIWEVVSSSKDLPEKFFIGHHFKLQDGVFETQLKRSPAQKKKDDTGLWARVMRLWRRTEQPWQPEKETQKKRISQSRLRRRASRSALQLKWGVNPSAESTQSVATRTASPLEVATNETQVLPEDSPGRRENDGQAASPEKTIDVGDLAKKHGAAEVSSSQLAPSSKPKKRRTEPAHPEEDTSTDEVKPAEIGSQGPNKPSKEEAPKPSSKGVASTGVELKVEHQSHEAPENDLVEATKERDSGEDLKQATNQMANEAKVLLEASRKIIQATAGRSRTPEEQQELANILKRRQRIVDRRSRILIKR